MKKSVVYLSAFVMFIAVIAMSVGFSAAWFANVTESSSPILIGSDIGTAYVSIKSGTLSGTMSPAVFKDGFLLTSYDETQLDVFKGTAYKKAATKASFNTKYRFDGQPDHGLTKRTIYISIEGVYFEDPLVISSGDNKRVLKPNFNLNENNYIDYIGCKFEVTETDVVTPEITEEHRVVVLSTPSTDVTLKCEFYYSKGDEILPANLVGNNLFFLLKVSSNEVSNAN